MTRWISLVCLILLISSSRGVSQNLSFGSSLTSSADFKYSIRNDSTDGQTQKYPNPKKVLRRSLILPGWGQVTNKQAWKVPIVYGLLGGLVYYSMYNHDLYTDYRAAFYNLNPNTPDDNRFGPTPDYISENANLNSLRDSRNFYRNRRDLTFVMVGLAYALNVVDAYVYAHLRPFDVSDDLSLKARVTPGTLMAVNNQPVPAISISIKF
ncbi:DUF5683 domain-containing protein [Gracilimonas tropica]|uniref:DUF5683 domain-containing protein n=1 Tax=Gracilimonas tropica TaxID=454600 RepID=UPI00039B84C9|nr:DUF5683 domain-containing protein [Gracilimonas tropica]